jgi:hypothetical protein
MASTIARDGRSRPVSAALMVLSEQGIVAAS